jgi:nitroreductase
MDVLAAIKARRACRAFLNKSLDEKIVKRILSAALHAPSNKNTQPWRIAVLTGEPKTKLGEALIALDQSGEPVKPDFSHIDKSMGDVAWARAKACGVALYGALDIKREDHERRQSQWQSNYRFFDAPVGLIFYMKKTFPDASLFDAGIFLSHIMLAAETYGVATCPQMSMGNYPDVVRKQLNLPDDEGIICGMSMGFADNAHPVNQYCTVRDKFDELVEWFN